MLTVLTSGPGTQTLRWRPTSGGRVVVVMNPNASAGVSITGKVGAIVPDLGLIAAAVLAAGGILFVTAIVLIALSVVRASR